MIWIITSSVLLVIVIAIFASLLFIYEVMYHSPKKGQNDEMRADPTLDYQGMRDKAIQVINHMLSLPYEDLYIESKDGLRLHAYLYKNEKSNHFVLMFNGYRGTPRRDFAGGAAEFINMGLNVLLCDERAHGRSEGRSITFGRKEQYDVVSWINFVKEKWGDAIKITIVGISMGGATVLYASDKVDPDVKVIADCPYSSQKDVIKNTMVKLKYPAKLLWPFAYLSCLVFCHAALKDDAVVNVSKSKSKILIIHGTGDTIVPYKMSERVYLANKDHVQYETFEGVEHALSYLKDSKRYREIVKKFIEE